MVQSNKVLTVSYGTFSCTLEGFDDSFGTMKVIAEYFRDLASDDRYFGAEPPQPDADMLAHIAQKEIARRVEAHADQGGIVLRAHDEPARANATALPHAPLPEAPHAEKVGESARTTPIEPEVPQNDHAAADLNIPVAEDVPQGDGIASRLQRIRAVVSRNAAQMAAIEYSEDEHADGFLPDIHPPETAMTPVSEAAPRMPVPVASETPEVDEEASFVQEMEGPAFAQGPAEDAVAETVEASDLDSSEDGDVTSAEPTDQDLPEPIEAHVAESHEGDQSFDLSAIVNALDDDEGDIRAMEPPSDAADIDDDDHLFENQASGNDVDVPSIASGKVGEPCADDTLKTVEENTPEISATLIKVDRSSFAAHQDEFADETIDALDPSHEAVSFEEVRDGFARAAAGQRLADEVVTEEVDAIDLDAIMNKSLSQTDAHEDDPRSLDAQSSDLTESESESESESPDTTEAAVVQPRRPVAGVGKSRKRVDARPAPLKLVAEQRIDIDVQDRGPVRPRRVAHDAAENAAQPEEDSFVAFADDCGATELPELLEAAAAYMSFVEGRAQFSRPQLMTKVRQVEKSGFNREDGLRSFGQLLREGKIEKTGGGRFTASEHIGFRA